MKALVVDDSPAIRLILSGTLERNGFEVVEAENGLNALTRFYGEKDFNLVIIDRDMPIASGVDFLDTIRQENQFKNVPILLVTSEENVDETLRSFPTSATGLLVKPFSIADLQEKIEMLGLGGLAWKN